MYVTGIDPTKVRTAAEGAEFKVGTLGAVVTSAGPKIYVYIQSQSGGLTAPGRVVFIDGSNYEAALSTTAAAAPGTGTGKMVGVTDTAIASLGFGWVQVYGPSLVRTSASAAAYTRLNTTATAGQLDDDATAGARVIDGIVLDVATGGAAAETAGFLLWPRVGATL